MGFVHIFTMFETSYQLQILLSGFGFFSAVVTGYFLYRISSHYRPAWVFTLLCVFSGGWAFFEMSSYLVALGGLSYVFHILSVACLPFFAATLFHFGLSFYEDVREIPPPFSFFVLLAIYYGLAGVISMFLILDGFQITNGVISSVQVQGSSPYLLSFGIQKLFIMSFFLFSAALALLCFLLSFGRGNKDKKNQVVWFLTSFLLAFTLSSFYFFVQNIPLFFAYIVALPVFLFGAGYALRKPFLKYKKVFLTRTINIIIWFLIFFRLLFEKNPFDFGLSLCVLLFVIILGMLLIKSTEKEVTQKQELEVLNEKLKSFNTSLEWEVTERTRDLKMQKSHTDAIINSLSVGLIEYTEDFEVVRMNKQAEEFLGIEAKEGRDLKFQPANPETFDVRYQSLKDVLFSDLTPPRKGSSQVKRFPVRKDKEVPFQRIQNVVIVKPVMRVLEVSTFPMERGERKDSLPLYIKLLRDITAEDLRERKNRTDPSPSREGRREDDDGFSTERRAET